MWRLCCADDGTADSRITEGLFVFLFLKAEKIRFERSEQSSNESGLRGVGG